MLTAPEFDLSGRNVGVNYPPLVIAEIGINHEGCLKTAFEMVDAAHAAGAELIKHQTHIIKDEMSDEAKSVIPGNADVSIHEIMSRCALNEEDEFALKNYVESKGIIFISTPFSRAAVDRLERFDVPAYKIGSGECNNYPLIHYIASKKKPIILSTGMNNLHSIAKSVAIIREYQIPFSLLHCTSVYPTPPSLIRLGALQQLQEAFPDAVIGLSDHSIDNLACLAATAVGASILERHFTDHKSRKGPDIEVSMDKNELKELIMQSRQIALMRGGSKEVRPEEEITARFAYASVVASNDIQQGELLTTDNLWVRRPGNGDFLADDYRSLLGKVASKCIIKGAQIKKADIQ